jgi:hypothetical protein
MHVRRVRVRADENVAGREEAGSTRRKLHRIIKRIPQEPSV